MTISPDLMKAILAMHAYNRGYGEGIVGLGNDIGNATFVEESDTEENTQDASFYAAAYSYEGETIISYRGTDDLGADANTGWSVGIFGASMGSQAQLAQEFYNTVSGGRVAFDAATGDTEFMKLDARLSFPLH